MMIFIRSANIVPCSLIFLSIWRRREARRRREEEEKKSSRRELDRLPPILNSAIRGAHIFVLF